MGTTNKIALLRDMLETAEKNIHSAKRLLLEVDAGELSTASDIVAHRTKPLLPPSSGDSDDGRVIEGVFNGQNMIDSTEKTYPVPANYASKSKLVAGDQMKLTIMEDGKFIYKQIGPIERRSVVGPLTYENGQYRVLAESKSYKILFASVTFFRADVGDEVVILLPAEGEVEWGALDAVLPKPESA